MSRPRRCGDKFPPGVCLVHCDGFILPAGRRDFRANRWSAYRDTLHAAYTRAGITGHGEGAPIVRYHEDAQGAQKAAESVRELLLSANPMQFSKVMAEVFQRVQGEWAGKAAVDIALMDWVGQKLGIPL